MNLRRMIKKTPLPSGVYVVNGSQGVGKTSFVTALLALDYKYHRKKRVAEAMEVAERYRQESRVKLKISDRLYFSNIAILLDKRKRLYTHYVDVQRLGLPNSDYSVQYLPFGSVVFIQEADLQIFCRDWDALNNYLIALFKYVRHFGLTLFLDCQADGALDKAIRRLTVGRYYITESYTKRFFIFWKPRTWHFLYIRNQLNDVMKELASVGVNLNVRVVERGKLRYFGNVFERYDSFSGAAYFLHGIENVGYEYLSHPEGSWSVEGINKYCELHPIEKPDETKKGAQHADAAVRVEKKSLLETWCRENGARICMLSSKEVICKRNDCKGCPVLVSYISGLNKIS